jgi:hypothetical protein
MEIRKNNSLEITLCQFSKSFSIRLNKKIETTLNNRNKSPPIYSKFIKIRLNKLLA